MNKLIDFRFFNGKKSFHRGSREYKLLDSMGEKAWIKYLDLMAKNAVTVEYDSVKDEFVVFGGAGV